MTADKPEIARLRALVARACCELEDTGGSFAAQTASEIRGEMVKVSSAEAPASSDAPSSISLLAAVGLTLAPPRGACRVCERAMEDGGWSPNASAGGPNMGCSALCVSCAKTLAVRFAQWIGDRMVPEEMASKSPSKSPLPSERESRLDLAAAQLHEICVELLSKVGAGAIPIDMAGLLPAVDRARIEARLKHWKRVLDRKEDR